MSIEAMKLALEALEVSTDWDVNATGKQAKSMKAITALRTAIEQAERNEFNPDWDAMGVMMEEQQRMAAENETLKRCLFQMQKAAKELAEKQEPVAWMKNCADFWEYYTQINEAAQEEYAKETKMWIGKLRTAPPQREWVGLTDDERKDIFKACDVGDRGYVAAMVEAKLKEKNT